MTIETIRELRDFAQVLASLSPPAKRVVNQGIDNTREQRDTDALQQWITAACRDLENRLDA